MSTLTVVAEATTTTPPRRKRPYYRAESYQLDVPMCARCGHQHQLSRSATSHYSPSELSAYMRELFNEESPSAGDWLLDVAYHLYVERCPCCWRSISDLLALDPSLAVSGVRLDRELA